jgi:hypothetical protein
MELDGDCARHACNAEKVYTHDLAAHIYAVHTAALVEERDLDWGAWCDFALAKEEQAGVAQVDGLAIRPVGLTGTAELERSMIRDTRAIDAYAGTDFGHEEIGNRKQ